MKRMIACLLVMLLTDSPLLADFKVPIIVKEPAGIDRGNEPISGGIPLPDGVFRPGSVKLALSDNGKAVPVQVSEFVVGPDGFVRWALLDFQLDLKAKETRELTLTTGESAAAEVSLKVDESGEKIVVNTGRLIFTIAKDKPFGLLEDVAVDGKPVLDAGQVSYTDGLSNHKFLADKPQRVTVHYSGPLRVTIEVEGQFRDDTTNRLRYRTYVTAWAGRSDILVEHRLINSNDRQRYLARISGSRIELKQAARPSPVIAGLDKPFNVQGSAVVLHQGLEEERNRQLPAARLRQGDRLLWEGRGAGGWISTGSVMVTDRLFRTDPPRVLEVGEGGSIVLEAAAELFEGQREQSGIRGRPYALQDDCRWLYDCSHHSSEYRIDFDAPDDPNVSDLRARAANARVWAFAPGRWYSECEVLGVGSFGTLEDEKACHDMWGWQAGSEPARQPNPCRFVGFEDNHYESESDSAEALLLMFVRAGDRGYFDEAEAWVRYHKDLQTWRTDGWEWKDGGIWFPQGGPPGNRPVREKANLTFVNWNNGDDKDRTLWRLCMAKSCYCHFYGAGLVDWFCMTGDGEALYAAIDNCETKLDEFTHFRQFEPGKSDLASTRGFGRGFYVGVRTWMVQPDNPVLDRLVRLCRDTFVQLPDQHLDERGVYAVTGDKHPKQYLTDGIRGYMAEHNITVDDSGLFKNASGDTWKWRDIGGTWMISYIQHACNLLAEQTDDEDLMDYVIASGYFTSKYMMSPAARQTWYYTALDIPEKGMIWDEWKYDGLERNEFGEGPKHSGWYTRFFPDCCARAYSWTGDTSLLDRAVEFWSFGNRRRYQTTQLTDKHSFADHTPPKDDSILSTSRLFYESSHGRSDSQAPEAIDDLVVRLLGDGRAEVSFTAPADPGGRAVRYQVKAATMPIASYEQWDFCRDSGQRRNWWRAVNCQGEPAPKSPGAAERFVVTGLPDDPGKQMYFAVRTFDDSNNRSNISNVCGAK